MTQIFSFLEFQYFINLYFFLLFRTNLPKEMMGFPDFPVPEDQCSYVPQKKILNFLDLYAQHFGVKEHIKVRFFSH